MEATKTTLPPTLQSLLPLSVMYCQRQSSRVRGWRRWKSLLYSEKSTLNAATSTISPSKSCPWATWVVIKVSIIARRERGGGTMGSAAALSACTPLSPSSATIVVGSLGLSSTRTSLVMDCTHGLFDEPTLGPTFFFCALRCLRKVAPIGAVMWINSREGKFSNPKKFRTL